MRVITHILAVCRRASVRDDVRAKQRDVAWLLCVGRVCERVCVSEKVRECVRECVCGRENVCVYKSEIMCMPAVCRVCVWKGQCVRVSQ